MRFTRPLNIGIRAGISLQHPLAQVGCATIQEPLDAGLPVACRPHHRTNVPWLQPPHVGLWYCTGCSRLRKSLCCRPSCCCPSCRCSSCCCWCSDCDCYSAIRLHYRYIIAILRYCYCYCGCLQVSLRALNCLTLRYHGIEQVRISGWHVCRRRRRTTSTNSQNA